MNPDRSDATRFILLDTSHGGNVGSAARAMKVMGFTDLVLVKPRFADVLSQESTVAYARGAADILARARVVPELQDALDGVTQLVATAMTPRDFGPPVGSPREILPDLAQERVQAGQRVAFLFGGERHGLSNDDIYRSHRVLSIPTAAEYGSLNLAQAVQIVAYEWRQALGGFEVRSASPAPDWADARAIQGSLDHWRQALEHIGYLNPAAPKKLIPRLNQLANRSGLTCEEVHILRGIAAALLKR